ncbi:MAG: hypothetical protein EOO24_20095 [Comamonadaceae bacterium]|nr:MAG: hypothetical protein EOO24_20095 [Comamonadaceae bacterium]
MSWVALVVLATCTVVLLLGHWLRSRAREEFRRSVQALGQPDFSYDGPDAGFADSGSSIAVHVDRRLLHVRRGRRWRSYPLGLVRDWTAARWRTEAGAAGALVIQVDDPADPVWAIDMPSLEQNTWCDVLDLAVRRSADPSGSSRGDPF